MKLKDRIKTYNFWVSLASAIFLIINSIGQKFNFRLDEGIFSDIFTAICGILVLLGILVPPTCSSKAGKLEPEIEEKDEKENAENGEIETTFSNQCSEENLTEFEGNTFQVETSIEDGEKSELAQSNLNENQESDMVQLSLLDEKTSEPKVKENQTQSENPKDESGPNESAQSKMQGENLKNETMLSEAESCLTQSQSESLPETTQCSDDSVSEIYPSQKDSFLDMVRVQKNKFNFNDSMYKKALLDELDRLGK